MRNPEILPNYPEFRHELEPARNTCLRALMRQLEQRRQTGIDLFADQYLIEGIGKAHVETDESKGLYLLECQTQECESFCVVERATDAPGMLDVVEPDFPEECVQEN